MARPGDILLLDGSGFSFDSKDNLVLFSYASGLMLNVPPESATGTRLKVRVPEVGPTRISVVVGNLRSNLLNVRIVEDNSPILFRRFPFNADVRSNVTLEGLNLAETTFVDFGGVRAIPFHVNRSSVRVTIPPEAKSGMLAIVTPTGTSNEIRFKVTRGISAQVNLPPGVDLEMASLTVTFGVLGEAIPSETGEVSIEMNNSGLDFVHVLLPDAGSDPATLILHAAVLPDDRSVSIDSLSTATAVAIQGIQLGERVHPTSISEARRNIRQLREVSELADAIANGLAADAYFLNSLPSDFFRTSMDALDAFFAAESVVKSGLANGELKPNTFLSSTKELAQIKTRLGITNAPGVLAAPLAASIIRSIQRALEPEITEEQFDITVFQVGDTGNIGVENDSQLYLSTQIIDASNGTVLFPHITSYFDSNMTGPQGLGLLFWASTKEDYNQPRFRDASVEVVTPGVQAPYGPIAVRRYLALRTTVDRIFLPLIEQAVGDVFDPSTFTKILASQGPGVVNAFGTFMENGDAGKAIKSPADAILDDARSVPPGPITQAIAKEVGERFLKEALAKLAARIGAKFVPIVGQISPAIEILGAASTFGNVGLAIADLATTPSLIEFEVKWELKVTDVSPGVVARKNEDKVFTITGQGFSPITEGWLRTTTIEPRVLITDLGKAGDEPFRIKPLKINSDGTQIQVEVPWFYMGDVKGPLSVSVVFQDVVAEAPNKIEVVTELRVDSLNPMRGKSNDEVEIIGAGFSENRLDNQVFFDGGGGENLTATVLTSSETKLLVVAPEGTKTGQVFVKVRNDVSDGLLFTVTTHEVRINFGDNGRLNDDTFALFVDDKLIHSMPAPARDAGTFAVELEEGSHKVTLRGITAPDDQGTYFIGFKGAVTRIDGDSTSGGDLNAGTEKHFLIEVGSEESPESGEPTLKPRPTITTVPTPTATPIPTPTPRPTPLPPSLELGAFQHNGQAWQKISSYSQCLQDPCLRSGEIPDGGFSSALIMLFPPSDPRFKSNPLEGNRISFDVKVSSEECCDKLTFSISGTEMQEWSGNIDWHRVEFDLPSIRPLLLEWNYRKSESGSEGDDAAWLDRIVLE